MFKSDFFSSKCMALALMSLALVTSNTYADVYKWRNARGVMQYSDRPPTVSFTKATRNEIINALQSKDVCTLPNNLSLANSSTQPSSLKEKTTLASVASTKNNAFFGRSNAPAINNASSSNIWNSNKTANNTSKLVNRYKGAFVGRPTNSLAASNPSAVPSMSTGTKPANVTKLVLPAAVASPVVIADASVTPKPTIAPAVPATTPTTPVAGATPSTPPISNQAPNIVQIALMPAVDISKNVTPAAGYSVVRIQPTTEVAPPNGGAFRVNCAVSHMSNDDPLMYPNQPGASHHHTFFGNTSANAKSDLMTLASTGNSTCNGGTMNRSAYWVPSMIDTKTNAPIVPDSALFYYKTGDFGAFPVTPITAPPKGLRMITGNAKATTANAALGLYTCMTAAGSTPWQPNVVNCAVGDTMQLHIDFPQCWDGKNLDSPDHKSHMSHRVNAPGVPASCPATHPVMIPQITLNLNYKMTVANQTANWRLASDNYATTLPGGYSTHADWVNGWDEKTMQGIVNNCLNKNLDGHAHLLCDGRTFF